MTDALVVIDDPLPRVRRLTLNRPAKRNALNNELRTELLRALIAADEDPQVRVTVIRGAGSCFCAGYDLNSKLFEDHPYHTAKGLGLWPRHLVEGYFQMWDLAKPVIAQVHGYCLAGGSELASACDLVYVADDAKIGYPAVRSISPPDTQVYPWLVGMRRAMEMMLSGDAITGVEAVAYGFANRAFPSEALEPWVLKQAERIAQVPTDVQQLNKRAVHRQMEAMGMRNGIRLGTELQALGGVTETARAFAQSIQEHGLTQALTQRDEAFGDYRTQAQATGKAKP